MPAIIPIKDNNLSDHKNGIIRTVCYYSPKKKKKNRVLFIPAKGLFSWYQTHKFIINCTDARKMCKFLIMNKSKALHNT